MTLMTTALNSNNTNERNIISQNNLTLCRADYFEACWCPINSSEPTDCDFLLRHVLSYSNSSYFCFYHEIRRNIECVNSSYIFSKSYVSNIYIYLTLFIFIIGLLGNGLSIVILLCSRLRVVNVYKNLTIFCFLNILYLITIFIRHINGYDQDLRDVSTQSCRLHTFAVTFIGHLCSWQLVSTSIQRLHALLSLQSHRTTSWLQTWVFFLSCIVMPLFIYNGQILFNYGLFKNAHICVERPSNSVIKRYRQALKYPLKNIQLTNKISVKYHTQWAAIAPVKLSKKYICYLWNMLDIFLYAVIPFIIIFICSLIIIMKVVQRRRAAASFGGMHRSQQHMNTSSDHLSALLIAINILFLIMTGPFNIYLIIQSKYKCLLRYSPSPKISVILQEYLCLLQNSYHALSFIFYCLIGRKFRNSAKSICRRIPRKIIDYCFTNAQERSSLKLCCFDQTNTSNIERSQSSNSQLSNSRQFSLKEKQANNSSSMNVTKRSVLINVDVTRKTVQYKSKILENDPELTVKHIDNI